jgi:hypothetical protein
VGCGGEWGDCGDVGVEEFEDEESGEETINASGEGDERIGMRVGIIWGVGEGGIMEERSNSASIEFCVSEKRAASRSKPCTVKVS